MTTETPNPGPAPVDQLSYERARDELVEIVRRLEGGQAPLDQTLELWERGEALAAHCRTILDQAQARLDNAPGAAEEEGTPDAG